MELGELKVFLTVATERSFSRAATKLYRTQPAVSQAVRRLEDQLGERLFDRSSKSDDPKRKGLQICVSRVGKVKSGGITPMTV